MALIKCDGISIAYEGTDGCSGSAFWIEQGDYLCIVGEKWFRKEYAGKKSSWI